MRWEDTAGTWEDTAGSHAVQALRCVTPIDQVMAFQYIPLITMFLLAGARMDCLRLEQILLKAKNSTGPTDFSGGRLEFKTQQDQTVYNEYCNMLEDLLSKPQSLFDLATHAVRKSLGEGIRGKLEKVSLTDVVKKDLMLVKLDDLKQIQFDRWPWPFESDISSDEYDDP